jgi:hypothetical protein
MLCGGVAVDPASSIFGRFVGSPPGPTDVEEHEDRESINTNAKDAVAAVEAQLQKRQIMA